MELYDDIEPEMLRYWVWLSLVFGAGSQKLLSYLQMTESPMEIYEGVMAGRFRADAPRAVGEPGAEGHDGA